MEQERRNAWLRQHRTETCPECGGKQVWPQSLIRATFWCSACSRAYQVINVRPEARFRGHVWKFKEITRNKE